MGRPDLPSPSPPAPTVDGDAELWASLAWHFGSRLSLDQPRGFATAVRNRWLELNASDRPPAERVELLIAFAVERGAPERDARGVVDRARARLADDPDAGERRGRHEVLRRDLGP